jgi:3-oxoacyl-[acyl-carrier-protein] synthase II
MSGRRVVVTGIGLVSPFGGDAADFFERLLAAESAVRFYESADVPRPLAIPAVRCNRFDVDGVLGRALAGTMDRFSQLGAGAALAAWRDAGFAPDDRSEKPDCGVAWGTALGGTLAYEHGYRELWLNGRPRISPLSVVLGMNNAAASHIAILFGLANACLSYTVACASSAIAIGEAFRRIRAGEATVMVAGGSDAPHAYGVVRAWEALRVLAPGDADSAPRACRPFDRQRSGLVLGEGAGALVLEEREHALARGATIHAELAGYGSTCDHSHLVRPEVGGQTRAIELAMADAGLARDEIGYINAHGTATREGDPTEIAAIRAYFGPRAEHLAVSATKSMHGHLLGAAGAVEAIVTVLALRRGAIPPTAWLEDVDPDCGGVRHVTGRAEQAPAMRAALSNSFAFGGSNAVLAFRAH